MQRIHPDRVRLSDIEDYKITNLSDKKDLHAVCYNIAVIGEAAGRLSPELKQKYSDIPWPQITGIRHKLIHDYGKVDVLVVQDVITDKLPALKKQIQAILDNF